MNKNRYRIIFNKARGLLMAVAEICVSRGKASGETSAPAQAGVHAPTVGIQPLAFLIWAALGMVITSAAQAQIVADPNASGNQRPTVLNAPNNVPLVNIQTPSAAGVSHNTYQQFDVQQQGAILNNSRSNVQTQLGGWVQGNPWLANGGARVILNEVNSNNPSQLRGYVEVAGQRAQVVIANPAGVTCDGCGFINANRATITTGTPLMNNGNLDGFRVQGGTVSITGNGMDARNTDYTDVLARAVQINAGVWTNELNVVTGANEISLDQSTSTPRVSGATTGSGAAPTVAIDTGQLGGMYAGKISLLATEAGVGVSNAGKIYASAGDVVISANGELQNAGQITSTHQARLDAQNGLSNTGTVYAQGDATLSTRGNISNSGANAVIAAQGDTTLSATGANSTITSTRDAVFAAGLQTDGTVGNSGALSVNATQSITSQGKNLSGGDQSLASQTVDLSSSQTSARNLSVLARGGDVNLANATLAINETLSADAHQTLRTDGAQVSANQLNARARDLSNVKGQLIQTGSGDMNLNLPGTLDNTEGRIATNSNNVNLAANTFINLDGTLEHAGTGTLAIDTPTLSGTRGKIASNGGINLAATNATLNAATTSAQRIDIRTALLSHQGGTLVQLGSGAANIVASTRLDNTGGTIASNGATTLTVGTLKNQGGTIQAAGPAAADLTIKATGDIDNSQAGSLSASGNMTLTSDSLNNTSGHITAGKTLNSTTTHGTNNTQGMMAATESVSVSAEQLINRQGTIGSVQSSATVTARSGTLDNTAGRIEAAQLATVSALGIDNTDGTLMGKSLSVNSQAQRFNNTRGKLVASGSAGTDTLDVQSGTFINDSGLIQSASSLTLNTHGQLLDNRNSGTNGGIVGQGAVSLMTGDLNNQAGAIGSNAALTINSASINNTQGGNIVSRGTTTVNASTLDNQGGQIQSVDNADISLNGALNNSGGLLRSGQTLTVKADNLNNTDTQGSNQGLEGNNLSLLANSIDNTRGAIRANNDATLNSSGTINNSQGLVSAGKNLLLQDMASNKTLAIINTNGTLIAGQALGIHSASLSGDGKVLSLGNLTIQLKQSLTNTGQITANGDVTVQTDANLTNQGTLSAGNTLNTLATSIDNQASGTMSADKLNLKARDTFTNRGLINGGTQTVLEAQTLNNLGTGRIYGDHVALSATTLTNSDENGKAAVIAARDRLDIGAETIHNNAHAMLFSGGDLAIGRGLDANQRATGQAGTLNNRSATIEATGDADLNVRTINNINTRFTTTTESLPVQNIREYSGAGSPNRYAPSDVYIYNDESDHLHTPEGNYETWSDYEYTRSVTETRVDTTDPAQILSGGAMRINADTVNNDKSRIIAGGTLSGNIVTLNNTEVTGERVITDSGTVTDYWRHRQKGRDDTHISVADYKPAPTIQAITLTPSVYQQNTTVNGSGTQVNPLSTVTVNQTPGAASRANGTPPVGQRITPITQVTLANNNNASGPPLVVRSGGIDTRVSNNSLFGLAPNPAAHYLIETDPAFANYRSWLSSDYMLNALSLDPALIQKRLGDGFYEQKLIREQVAQLTGRRFLEGYANDEAQYTGLMNNGATFAKAYNLVPGVALSAAQMAQLTSDIVWLVEQDITLPNGTTTKALVPQLYARVQEGDLQSGGALIAGNNVSLNLSGNLLNSGTIAGRQALALTAENINNLGGRMLGNDVGVAAKTDLNNIGGVIAANNSLIATAGRDLNVVSTTRSQSNAQGSRTNIDRVAGLYVTGGTGALQAAAGRDVNLMAASVQNQGSGATTLAANNNINLGTVTQSSSNRIVWDSKNTRSDASRVEVGSNIQTQGNLTLQAGNDLNARGASANSAQGELLAVAGNNVNLTASEANVQVDEAHQRKSRGLFSSKTTTTRDSLDQTTAQATTFSGNTATVLAGNDINLTGSNVVSDKGTTLAAKNDINITAASNTSVENHFKQEKTSGLFSGGGFGVTIGTRQQSTDQQGLTRTTAASTVGSTQGDITLQAGRNYTQTGSQVIAPQGNVTIGAQRVDINEARETRNTQTETKFKQSGLTAAISSPLISAVQTAQQMSQAASDTSDMRMKALAAAAVGFNLYNNAGDMGNAAKALANGDISKAASLSLSLGGSKSESHTTQTSDMAAGSKVTAGKDVNITARNGDIQIQGSNIEAGRNLALAASENVKLLAAQNTAEQHSTNSSSSASIGVSLGAQTGVTLSGSRGRSNADGNDVSWTNTHLKAGEQASITSGQDTTLKGAVVTAPQITAKVGGDLKIESLQDTSRFDSKQSSLNASLTLGPGLAPTAGNIGGGKSRINSDYASVNEQSGLRAGDRGFDVNVGNNTDLKGGAITSTQAAIDSNSNRFKTGGNLTTSDIENSARYSGQGAAVNLGAGRNLDGKLALQGSGVGLGKDSGNASSTTQAAISGVAGNQAARTGDAESGLKKIFDVDKVQKEVDAQVRITQEFGMQAGRTISEYTDNKRKVLQEKLKQTKEDDVVEQKRLKDEIWELNMQERALNVLVGALTGSGLTTLSKEVLSTAAEKMRNLMIESSKKFPDVVDTSTGQLLSNMTGKSDGVGGDGVKLGGTRLDLDLLCGKSNERCKVKPDNTLLLDAQGRVQFDNEAAGMSMGEFIKNTPEGKKMSGLTGGIQGGLGTLFGGSYQPGGLVDKVIELFAGPHDLIGGQLTGLYDNKGNTRRGMSDMERAIYDNVITTAAIPLAAPFAAAAGLSAEVWKGIETLFRIIK